MTSDDILFEPIRAMSNASVIRTISPLTPEEQKMAEFLRVLWADYWAGIDTDTDDNLRRYNELLGNLPVRTPPFMADVLGYSIRWKMGVDEILSEPVTDPAMISLVDEFIDLLADGLNRGGIYSSIKIDSLRQRLNEARGIVAGS